MTRLVFFPAQYGTPDRWMPCTVDAFGCLALQRDVHAGAAR
ncbi:hypothetical protein [Pseudomonas sp. CFBP 8772]|nr:hypothetical protein [Pseudomonas sp. CFBP 8772]